MFKKMTVATFAIALALPVAALAPETMDANGNGLVTADECANADGALADDEISAAREVGALPDAS